MIDFIQIPQSLLSKVHVEAENQALHEEPSKIAEVFQVKFAALCVLDSDVDNLADSLKEGLLSTVEEALWRQKKKLQSSVINEILDLCDQRLQLKQQKYTSTEARLEYRKVNRKASKSGLRINART